MRYQVMGCPLAIGGVEIPRGTVIEIGPDHPALPFWLQAHVVVPADDAAPPATQRIVVALDGQALAEPIVVADLPKVVRAKLQRDEVTP